MGGTIAFFYFCYEKPAQTKELDNVNLNIYAIDSVSGAKIRTGYKVYVNGILHAEGKTLINGAKIEIVPTNSSVVVHNYNFDKERTL